MKTILHPWQILLLVLADWINRQQQYSIEYLIAENRILREKLGRKGILLNDEQRRLLAIKSKVLGWKALAEICSIVTLCGFGGRIPEREVLLVDGLRYEIQ
jgi:putative transposase